MIAHLKSIGVTAVELLPCQSFVSEPFLLDRGLKNYWGYNPVAWFAPANEYAVDDAVVEFKTMVRALHQAGIEVILDVVFNHTAEGNESGPLLCFKGLDNSAYYRLMHDRRHYENLTGCGNTVNCEHPQVRALIIDCLKYWVEEMHVDGFRFDLATVLARDATGFNAESALFTALRDEPSLAYIKLIAEPWDVGLGGYQLGRFPAGWSEWNDRYRDAVRAFWRGDNGKVGEFAERIAGSSDIFRHDGRKPTAGINFVTAHDGFTLNDLVSYSERHNEANGENNADGHHHNLSWNCGAEGPTEDAALCALRKRQMRNVLATLFLVCRACRCCRRATNSAARSGATTTRTARTTRSRGSTGGCARKIGDLLDFVRLLARLAPRARRISARDLSQGNRLARRSQRRDLAACARLGNDVGRLAGRGSALPRRVVRQTQRFAGAIVAAVQCRRRRAGVCFAAAAGRQGGGSAVSIRPAIPRQAQGQRTRARGFSIRLPRAALHCWSAEILDAPLIERLARLRGIGDAYHDYRGELRHFTLETKAGILRAMGCAPEDSAALAAEIGRLEGERHRRFLPTVAAVHGQRAMLDLNIAARDFGATLKWTLVTEHGERRSGHLSTRRLRGNMARRGRRLLDHAPPLRIAARPARRIPRSGCCRSRAGPPRGVC